MDLHARHAAYVVAAYAASAGGLVGLTFSSVVRAWTWRRRAHARAKRDAP